MAGTWISPEARLSLGNVEKEDYIRLGRKVNRACASWSTPLAEAAKIFPEGVDPGRRLDYLLPPQRGPVAQVDRATAS